MLKLKSILCYLWRYIFIFEVRNCEQIHRNLQGNWRHVFHGIGFHFGCYRSDLDGILGLHFGYNYRSLIVVVDYFSFGHFIMSYIDRWFLVILLVIIIQLYSLTVVTDSNPTHTALNHDLTLTNNHLIQVFVM